jgi:hypothetical protein
VIPINWVNLTAIFGLIVHNGTHENEIKWNETEWNINFIPLFGYFMKCLQENLILLTDLIFSYWGF